MTTFSKSRLEDAVRIFKGLGFDQQHTRIYHYKEQIGNYWYFISVGLEDDTDESRYDVALTVMQQPLPKHKMARPTGMLMKAVEFNDAPTSLQDRANQLLDELETIG